MIVSGRHWSDPIAILAEPERGQAASTFRPKARRPNRHSRVIARGCLSDKDLMLTLEPPRLPRGPRAWPRARKDPQKDAERGSWMRARQRGRSVGALGAPGEEAR